MRHARMLRVVWLLVPCIFVGCLPSTTTEGVVSVAEDDADMEAAMPAIGQLVAVRQAVPLLGF